MPAPKLLITGGRVIDPDTGLDRITDIAVADGRIAALGDRLDRSTADRIIDAEGCIVMPGLIDPHVHLREPGHEHKETIDSGARAAAAGGFTSVCCMPNTLPALDTPELVRFIYDRAVHAAARVFPVAAATKGRKGEDPTEFQLLARAGAVAFSDDGDCIASAGMMARVLGMCAHVGKVFMQHAQEPTMTRGGVMHAGPIASRLGLGGWPREAEEIIVERDVRLARKASAAYHVQHISSGETVDIIRRARASGIRATGEASPHHLHLTHEVCDGYNTLGKVNPPLREAKDVQALRAGVADGTITILGTDHAPHSDDEKALPFEEAPFGFIGLECALPLYAEALVTSGAIDWQRLVELLTTAPAKLCGLDSDGLGKIAIGGSADVSVFDPALDWRLAVEDLKGRSRNTPFLGRVLHGRSVLTVCCGIITHDLMPVRIATTL